MSAIAVNAASKARGKFGDAGALIHLDGSDPATARQGIAEAKRRFGAVEVIAHTSLVVPGSVTRLDLRSQDPHGAFGHSMLALRAGRYPHAAGEIALTAGAARLLSVHIGARTRLGRVERTVV